MLLYAHMRQRENVSPVTGTQHQRKKIAPIPPFHCTCACVLARTNKRRNAFAPNLIHLSLSCTLSLFLPTPPLFVCLWSLIATTFNHTNYLSSWTAILLQPIHCLCLMSRLYSSKTPQLSALFASTLNRLAICTPLSSLRDSGDSWLYTTRLQVQSRLATFWIGECFLGLQLIIVLWRICHLITYQTWDVNHNANDQLHHHYQAENMKIWLFDSTLDK